MEYEYNVLRQCSNGTIIGYCNLNGEPIKRTPKTHPYSYDAFVVFKARDYRKTDHVADHDRMRQWEPETYSVAAHAIFGTDHPTFSNCTPTDINRFLSHYFAKPVICTALLENCNWSSGYPYWTFCYRDA